MVPLPIDDALPALLAALRDRGRAVLQAPPGAGKTTRVPLALLDAGLVQGRIVMLEPRRIATRAAAARMAATLGQSPGETVGYRIRGEARVSRGTRIEVVTEGILTRMIQSDPELSGIGAVIFDEFHERSLNADLGLALVLDLAALRPDLMILVMSATLDAAPVAALMQAPVVTSAGHAFPVDIRHLPRPLPRDARIEPAMAGLIVEALEQTEGGVLAFLPGEREIRAVERILAPRLPAGHVIRPLYGTLPPAAQETALAPDPLHRKIVLATNIAETSLTIPDIRVVVDAGLARRARFDPGTAMSRLVTDRVTRAEAVQRAGRAGRVAPGVAFRLWARAEDGAMADHPAPEIEVADLAGLALDLALWGTDRLPFLTPPPAAGLAAARAVLRDLGALDGQDRITAHGRKIAPLPLHPRLAHMLQFAGAQAANLAALLSERDPMPGAGVDLALRLDALAGRRAGGDAAAFDRIRAEARRLSRDLPGAAALSPGAMASLAFPDRIGQRRPGEAPRWLLTGGKGAAMPPGEALSMAPWIVVTDSDGNPREAQVRLALSVNEAEIRDLHSDRITRDRVVEWSARDNRVIAREREMLGAVALADRVWPDPPPEAVARAMCDGIRTLGLRFSGAARRLQTRVALARQRDPGLPDLSDTRLTGTLDDWLAPYLSGVRSAADWQRFDPYPALAAQLDHGQRQRLDTLAPARFTTPLGREIAIDYDGEVPAIEIRLQEMFGVTRNPMAGGTPIRVTLLSPGGKPIQVTTDIPGFWRTSYADVRKEMRGRYPRHPWPEDPTVAEPTLRAKPRGT